MPKGKRVKNTISMITRIWYYFRTTLLFTQIFNARLSATTVQKRRMELLSSYGLRMRLQSLGSPTPGCTLFVRLPKVIHILSLQDNGAESVKYE